MVSIYDDTTVIYIYKVKSPMNTQPNNNMLAREACPPSEKKKKKKNKKGRNHLPGSEGV